MSLAASRLRALTTVLTRVIDERPKGERELLSTLELPCVCRCPGHARGPYSYGGDGVRCSPDLRTDEHAARLVQVGVSTPYRLL